jgi:hypothetical protein
MEAGIAMAMGGVTLCARGIAFSNPEMSLKSRFDSNAG